MLPAQQNQVNAETDVQDHIFCFAFFQKCRKDLEILSTLAKS